MVNREASGVTAACAALPRDVYERVGGLTELLPNNYNDVDLTFKVRHAGLRVLWIAECRLYHFESQTRDHVVQPWERALLYERWGGFDRDPYLPWLK